MLLSQIEQQHFRLLASCDFQFAFLADRGAVALPQFQVIQINAAAFDLKPSITIGSAVS